METKKLTCYDLMVGDYVMAKKEPIRIATPFGNETVLHQLTLYGYTSDGAKAGPFLETELTPIPLTAEILEMNGLKPHRRYIGMFVERTDKYQLYVNKSNITAYILLEDGAEEHQWILPRPMYVHELQHAVKSFKINKEIVL